MKLSERWYDNQRWHVRETEKTAGPDGVALFEISRPENQNVELFASAILKDRQAFSPGNSYTYGRQNEPWHIYAFTDRPAYRPKETVQWKFIARRYNGSVYSTPSDQVIVFEITDPQGAKIKEDKITLNAFGSASGSLDLTESMPLGEYRVTFLDRDRKAGIGSATLFRLEEYKLPEFKITVQTPEEGGRKKTFRLGEKVEVNIQADYYFGGPVANANVEVIVYQNPFYQYWHAPRDFPWFYEDMDSQSRWGRWYGGDGPIIKRETLKTDATGKASLNFETPRDSGQDFQYRIEARVTDSSRREIVSSGKVNVTRQRYYVYPQPDHNLYRPQDKVRIEFKALDANEQPVRAAGTVTVTRDYWFEIWLDPDGQEVKGDDLKRLRASQPIFPPPARPNQANWKLKFRGYQHDEILTRALQADTNGVAEITFTPEREGYYRVAWNGEDRGGETNRPSRPSPIHAETTVWVATGASTDLGYRHGGVEIIVDKDTFRVGQKAPIMLVAPTSDRHVLFTVEGEELYSYQIVHLDGTVKLIELPIEEKHVPNVFLSATLVDDRQIFTDVKQVVVPPTKNFLTVDVKPDRPQYLPREDGTFTVTTRDEAGNPVPAEVAFSLVDESVFYIQQDYAGDPRQFYFGTKRQQMVQTQSTMNQKRYARLVVGEKDELIDDRDLARRRSAGARGQNEEARDDFLDRDENGLATMDVVNGVSAYFGGASGGGGGGGVPMGGMRARRSLLAANRPAASPAAAFEMKDKSELAKQAAPPGPEPAVQVRNDFRSTITWEPNLVTDGQGRATVKVKYPDSLTGWKASARVASRANQFGIADSTTRTKMPLIVRLQAPRFFVVGDTVTLSAVLNNNTDDPMEVKVALEMAGLELAKGNGASRTIQVPAQGESRADWIAQVGKPGDVKLKVTGRGPKFSDAMEKSYLAYDHGIEKFVAKSGKARGDDITVKLDLPKERKPGSTTLIVQLTPSMAVTMLDALPYLIDYPYGCTEQTMSRFLPAAITSKTLKDLGLQPEDVMSRLFGGIETNHAAATHPKGKHDLAELNRIISESLERLYDFQHQDGGWGWWKQGDSDHWMTAYVLWGMTLAKDAGLELRDKPSRTQVNPTTGLPLSILEDAAGYLDKRLVEEEENFDMQAWMLHALTVYQASTKKSATPFQNKAFDNLWNNREKLNAYTRALLALAAHLSGRSDQAKTLVQNLENGVKRDERPDLSVLVQPATTGASPSVLGTAHWGEDGIYWRWSEGGVEATAFALRALLTIDPQNKLIEPVTNWLLKNRRGAQWNSTRDTAIVILAMNDYLRTSGELKPNLEYELFVNGSSIAKKKISGADVFNAPSRFAIDPKLVKDANEIRIKRKDGSSALYFAVEAKFFSLEEPVAPAGNEIFVKRAYYKLVGRPTLLKGYVYERLPLRDGESVKSGERVETLLTIEAKNNYEYLIFEDLKPAGLEAVEVRSGESLYARELKSGAVDRKFSAATNSPVPALRKTAVRAGARPAVTTSQGDETDFTGRTRWVYQELRDRKVALFLDKLPEGIWELRYSLRAEVPGQFHALPVLGYAMYVPEIRCNGAELRITVEDAAP
ncbi:MAG TPA: MG2 domain-containing protein [Methylomirabilota bacterium]|nr:MG2 domain-containing protein [Methylomirabilota bacterium]